MNEEKSKSGIPVGLMWALTVAIWLISTIWLLDIFGNENLLFSSLIFYCFQVLCVVVFIMDIIKADIFNKPAWIIMIVFLPVISFPIYLVQRKRLIRIQERKNSFTGKKEE